jgi:hypothetical protein
VTTTQPLPEKRGAGGTPGGVGQFFIGLTMAVVGVYLLLNQVQVTTSFWNFGRFGGFGPTLLPLLVGVAFLFYNGKSFIGWLLTALGLAIVLAGILMNMDIYFRQTTLFNTIVMLGLLFGGLGVIARSLRSA